MKFKDAQTMAMHKFDTEDFLTRIKEEDESMLQHLPILKKMNEKGFITTQSQAGRKSGGLNKPYVTEERAFVQGFMPYKKAVTFLKRMNLYTNKNAINIMDSSQFFKSELDIPLTITTQNNKTNIETHMSLSFPIHNFNLFKKEYKLNRSENVLYVFCWDPIWNRNASNIDGLFSDVLRNL
jgi:hypothetical protein